MKKGVKLRLILHETDFIKQKLQEMDDIKPIFLF